MAHNQTETKDLEIKTEWLAYKWKALVIVMLSTFLGTIDVSIVNISFPILTRELNAELTTVVWVTLAYNLTSTSLMLILGRIGDMIGRKRIFTTGLLIFSVGLAACAVSLSITQLIFFRVIQALGSAMIVACGTAIIIESFPENERGKALGLAAVSVSAGFITGPILGGILLDWLNWRSIFYVRVPIALLVFVMSFFILKKDKKEVGRMRLDLIGTVLSSASLAFIMLGVSQARRFGLGSPLIQALLGLGILGFVLFLTAERRVKDPVVDLTLFKNSVFTISIASLACIFLAYPTYTLVMPFYLMQAVGLTPSKVGLVMAVTSMVSIIIGPISGSLSDRFGHVLFAFLGALLTLIAYSLMLGFEAGTQIITIIIVLMLFGTGTGLFQAPNNSSIMGTVGPDHLGTASALLATVRQVGLSLGMAMASTIYAAGKSSTQAGLIEKGLESAEAARQAIPVAFHHALLFSIVFLLMVVILTVLGRYLREGHERQA